LERAPSEKIMNTPKKNKIGDFLELSILSAILLIDAGVNMLSIPERGVCTSLLLLGVIVLLSSIILWEFIILIGSEVILLIEIGVGNDVTVNDGIVGEIVDFFLDDRNNDGKVDEDVNIEGDGPLLLLLLLLLL
jgi:hypothetical protein